MYKRCLSGEIDDLQIRIGDLAIRNLDERREEEMADLASKAKFLEGMVHRLASDAQAIELPAPYTVAVVDMTI